MVVGGEIAKGLEVVVSGLMEIVCILDGGLFIHSILSKLTKLYY